MPRENHFHSLFEKQFGDLPCGGFINPEIVEEDQETIVFRCHYNGFEADGDVWEYGFNIVSREFFEM